MRTLAVDPGLRACGVALFEGRTLVRIGLVPGVSTGRDGLAWSIMARAIRDRFAPETVDVLALEMMVVRARRRDVNPDNLMQLVGVAGALTGVYLDVEHATYRPETWKGGVKKRIHHPRIIAALNATERALLNGWMLDRPKRERSDVAAYIAECRACRGNSYPNDPVHNVIDGIGIGLFHVGRRA